MNTYELIAFIIYFLFMTSIGVYFFVKGKDKGEKDYFLGGRNMGGWVTALSAGASDMSAWVLMGLPGAIYLSGMNQIWISIGLIIGTVLAWIFIAPKLRKFAIKANDSITVPEFLTNRFKAKGSFLRVACAVVFLVGYLVYAASSIYACGKLFAMVVPSDSVDMRAIGMVVFTIIILAYTLLGGFKAVCWTDFFQGMLMLVALMIVPIIASIIVGANGAQNSEEMPEHFYSLLIYADGQVSVWGSIANIITGLGWGLGYFGMPHIIVRYMSIKSKKEMRKSQVIGSTWTFLILTMATVLAIVARSYLTGTLDSGNKELIFAMTVRQMLGVGALALLGGILIAAILAAAMSTADSQLLASSSAFASDIYKTVIKAVINKKADDKKVLDVGRYAVIGITALAFGLAMLVHFLDLTDIMGLVSAAWSIFGAAFSPVIILSLFWRRFNYMGAIASIFTGFVSSILWMVFFNFEYYGFSSVIFNTGIYEIVPGFILGIIVGVIVSLYTKAPEKEVFELFDSVKLNDVE